MFKMTTFLVRVVILVSSFQLVTNAQAGTIFNTFGPGNSFSPTTSYVIGKIFIGLDSTTVESGDQFVPGQTFMLTNISLAVQAPAGLDVRLTNDIGGKPGTEVETFHASSVPVVSIVDIDSVLNPLLIANHPYWLIVTTPNTTEVDEGEWRLNSIGDVGPTTCRVVAGSILFDPTFCAPDSPVVTRERAAFRVSGTLVSVPEPPSFFLLAIGLASSAMLNVFFRTAPRRAGLPGA